MSPLRKSLSLVVLLGLAFLVPARAQPPLAEKAEKKPALEKQAASKFVRVSRDKTGEPLALETAVVRYVPASGEGELTVDLVGVVHVGDRDYYEKINKRFEEYDVVLYELVAPEGTRIPKAGRRQTDNPLAFLQHLMKSILELESQTERIDYTKKNLVHADLSPEGMAEAMRKRGDDGMTLVLSIAADLIRQQNIQERKLEEQRKQNAGKWEPEPDLLALLFDPDRALKLKRALAEQFEMMDEMGGLGGTINTILVTDRNEAAMKVFQKELAKGKKKIAIFYGAAHMPDFEKRLRGDFGLKKASEEWLTAWDLDPKK